MTPSESLLLAESGWSFPWVGGSFSAHFMGALEKIFCLIFYPEQRYDLSLSSLTSSMKLINTFPDKSDITRVGSSEVRQRTLANFGGGKPVVRRGLRQLLWRTLRSSALVAEQSRGKATDPSLFPAHRKSFNKRFAMEACSMGDTWVAELPRRLNMHRQPGDPILEKAKTCIRRF